jgi:uncharacterized protein YjbI with pentapeptide repeats
MAENRAGKTLRGRPFSARDNLRGANFRKSTLCGVNFKGLDLSEADFTDADIRGADFTSAILNGANFTGVRAGLQRKWAVSQFIILVLTLVIFSVAVFTSTWSLVGLSSLTAFMGAIFAGIAYRIPFASENYSIVPILFIVAVNAIVLITIIYQGFTVRAFATITTLMVATVALLTTASTVIAIIHIIQYIQNNINDLNTITTTDSELFALVFSFLIGFVVIIAFTLTIAAAVAVIVVFAAATTAVAKVTVKFPLGLVETLIGIAYLTSNLNMAFLPLCLVVWVGTHIAKQSLARNDKFAVINSFSINFSTIGGTNFSKADLTRANFTNAVLQSTNFRGANLTQVYWKNAQNLERSVLGNSYLQNLQIRQLVITLEGQEQNFDRLDFRGINLQEANLQYASFIDTDLSQANLQEANLFEAKLVQTNLDQANLSNASLTGAYIEDWGITRKTRLDNVRCKYVYLKLPTDGDRDPNRLPPPEQGEFGENDFNIFITSVLDTLDLYHRDSINAGLAITILKGLTEDYPVQFELVGLEKRSDEQFVIRLKVFGQTSHFQIQREYYARYEQTLPFYDPKKLMSNTESFVKEIIKTVKENPGTHIESLHNQGIVITGGSVNMTAEENRHINTGGGNYNEHIQGDYVQGNYYAAGQPQSLAQAAAEIQQLLKQLEQTYPTATTSQQMVVAAEAINQIENNPTMKQKVINAVKEGGLAAFEKAIDNPAGAFVVGAIKGWQEIKAKD